MRKPLPDPSFASVPFAGLRLPFVGSLAPVRNARTPDMINDPVARVAPRAKPAHRRVAFDAF